MDIMGVNAKGKMVREKKILLYGECLKYEHPQILENFEDFSKFSFCPERGHINMLFYKLAAMMTVATELVVLTVDGSPHCVQMHYIADEVLKYSSRSFPVKHLVVNRGKIYEIDPKAVKLSRYLSKIQNLLNTQNEYNREEG